MQILRHAAERQLQFEQVDVTSRPAGVAVILATGLVVVSHVMIVRFDSFLQIAFGWVPIFEVNGF